MSKIKEAVAEALRTAERAIIFGHVNPDGDAIGSALGLMWALRRYGTPARVSFADPMPFTLDYLPGAEEIDEQAPAADDLIIALDSSDPDRMGDMFSSELCTTHTVVNIDHHVTNEYFGTINWIDDSYPAVAQMIFHLLPLLDIQPDERIATCLLTGFVTDTNAFSTPHTTPQLLADAGALMAAGASLAEIQRRAYTSRSLTEVRLWSEVLPTLRYENHLVWAVSTPEMRKRVNAGENDSGGMSTFLLTIREAWIAVMLTLLDDGNVKVSMRAEPGYNVADLAAELGGGGHPAAAGVTLEMTLDDAIETVMPRLKTILRQS